MTPIVIIPYSTHLERKTIPPSTSFLNLTTSMEHTLKKLIYLNSKETTISHLGTLSPSTSFLNLTTSMEHTLKKLIYLNSKETTISHLGTLSSRYPTILKYKFRHRNHHFCQLIYIDTSLDPGIFSPYI